MNKSNLITESQIHLPSDELISTHFPQIERVFVFYCSFADKDNYALLKIQNFQRLIADLQLGNHQHLIARFDVIFYSHAETNSLDIFKFIKTLQDIATLVFQGIPSEKRLQKLLTVHLKTLAELILTDTDFGQSLALVSGTLLKQSSFIFLKRFQQTLSIFYVAYFSKEGRGGFEQQLKILCKLSRQMNLVPRVVTKPIVYLIYRFLRQKTAISVFRNLFRLDGVSGKMYKFDFMAFMEYIVILAHINSRIYEPEHRKIYKLLELMEVSPGCRQLAKKQRFKALYLSQMELEQEQSFVHSPQRKTTREQMQTQYQTKTVSTSPMQRKLGSNYLALKTKFIKLCAKKHVQTNFYLPLAMCKKLLRKICPSLSCLSIELMVNAAGRLNFQNFVALLDSAALKIDVKPEMLYQLTIYYETENYNLSAIIQHVKLSAQDQHYSQQILQFVQPYIRSIYQYYESNGSLPLASYLKLLQQTSVIPKIVQTVEAIDVFRFSVSIEDKMTYLQFQKSLKTIVVSVHFEYELQGIERLIYLLQKICQSRRGEILMKKNLLMMKQHPLYKLRLAYQQFYKSIENKLVHFNQVTPFTKCKTFE